MFQNLNIEISVNTVLHKLNILYLKNLKSQECSKNPKSKTLSTLLALILDQSPNSVKPSMYYKS